MPVSAPWFDGNPIDCISVLVAIGYAARRWRKGGPDRKLMCLSTARDISNGASLFPLLLLALSVASTRAVQLLLGSNRAIMTIAGVCSLIALLEE